MSEFTTTETDQGLRGAWAAFIALERDDLEHANAVTDEFGDLLHAGWPIVAAVLRKALREHAEQLGCSCGSERWLQDAAERAYSR